MKDYIVIFFVVLAVSCFMNGNYPPYSLPVGINGTVDTTTGSKRTENMIPEINYTEATSNATQITGVDNSDDHKGSTSQMGNNF